MALIRNRIVVFVVGLALGVAIPPTIQSLIDAYIASSVKRSIANAIVISRALEQYKRDHGNFPVAAQGTVVNALVPKYLKNVPTDFSGRPYTVVISNPVPLIVEPGRGGFIVESGEVRVFHAYRPGDEEQATSNGAQ